MQNKTPQEKAAILAAAQEIEAQNRKTLATLAKLPKATLKALHDTHAIEKAPETAKPAFFRTELKALFAAGLIDAQTIETAATLPKAPSIHHSSLSDEWSTPDATFQALNSEFNFTLDAAATAANAKCERYFSIVHDGTRQSWKNETVWLNPPYSRGKQNRFIEKAAHAAQREGATVVMLIPARPDTVSWHRHIIGQPDVEVRFIKGRLRFGDSTDPAPFPSAIVIFYPLLKSPRSGFFVTGMDAPKEKTR